MAGNVADLVIGQIKSLKPSFLSKTPHFNFITVHYFWVFGLCILGSVILFGSGSGNLLYIDSLFLASAANTQAGLNTIDINKLNKSQQVVLYLLCMATNPITINSFVVFLRLYWFERRLQHVVHEARQRRGTISKSKSMARQQADVDTEKAVNGRNISVVRNGRRAHLADDGTLVESATWERGQHPPGTHTNNLPDHNHAREPPVPLERRQTEVKFAETVKRSDGVDDDATKLPTTGPDEEHSAFVERQRIVDNEVLRIPGPRDAEKGMRPERVKDGDSENVEQTSATPRMGKPLVAIDGAGHPAGQRSTTAEEQGRRERSGSSKRDRAKAVTNIFSFLKPRRPPFKRKKASNNNRDDDNNDNDGVLSGTGLAKRRYAGLSGFNLRKSLTFSRGPNVVGTPYLSWEPTIGRNSAFPDLTDEQRDELGGIEYRSLKTLALILTLYFWGFTFFAVACLLPWIHAVDTWGRVVDQADQGRTWWAIFTANSAFNDLGLTLTPDSMNSFSTAVFPMLIVPFLIIVGNTGFPVMLRFLIWTTSLFVPSTSGLYEELRFLLDHPRRCFTLMFPSAVTWWLFWLLVVMNGIDLLFFIVLDLGSSPVATMPAGIKVLDGLFQAVSTRTAGFSCVNLAKLHPGVQVSYMIMMYISVFPIAISVRRTNVYEEKSLGVYSQYELDDHVASAPDYNDLSHVGSHLRRQLSFDLWFLFIGFFILAISEGARITTGDINMFAVLFEVVSAYGTVGMSLGYPTVNASLSSQFSVVGKLVIIAMMIRGRHRGLPYGLDRAILLPSEKQMARSSADANSRNLARRHSHASPVAAAAGLNPGGLSLRQGRTPSMGTRRGSFGAASGKRSSSSGGGSGGGGGGGFLASLMQPGPSVVRDDPDMYGPAGNRLHGTDTNNTHDMRRSFVDRPEEDDDDDESPRAPRIPKSLPAFTR